MSGASSGSSTQNDWKLLVPYAGSVAVRHAGQVGERLLVAGSELTAPFDDGVEAAELDEPDGGLDVGHPPVEPGLQVRLDDDATGGVAVGGAGVHAVLAEPPGTRPDLRVADGQHPALAGGDELAGMEGEGDEVAVAADQFAAIRRSDGAGGVLDDGDPSWVAQRVHRVDVGRDPGLVDEDDGLRACRDHRQRSCPA